MAGFGVNRLRGCGLGGRAHMMPLLLLLRPLSIALRDREAISIRCLLSEVFL